MANNTKKKVEEVTDSENTVIETTVKTPAKERRIFAPTDVIPCRSVTYGELILPSSKNTDMIYSWADFGDVQEVEYQDLRALRSRRSAYIYGPHFVIDDEDLIAEWPELKDVYKSISSLNLDELFDLPVAQLSKKLQAMPKVYKETIKNAASARIISGELDSIAKIKAIDEVLNTDLKFYIQ